MSKEIISGWGNTSKASVTRWLPKDAKDVSNLILKAYPHSIISRGLGRSYGDASQLDQYNVIDLCNFNNISINKANNTVTAGAGVSFDHLLKIIIPEGYFVPVTAGTKFITVGGAIAADIHGKNHHRSGSFGNFLKEILLIDGDGKLLTLTPEQNLEGNNHKFFWNTIGGMGLTGVIIQAKFDILPIESSLISVYTERFKNLDLLMEAMENADDKYTYSVSWVDAFHPDHRGILTCGEHTKTDQLPNKFKDKPYFYDPQSLASAPSKLPSGILNQFTVRAFNEAWYRKSPQLRCDELQSISKYFYPLDGVTNWNRIYGSSGFIQYQFVVPYKSSYLVKYILDKLREQRAGSFLTVLKRFGASNSALLSFPIPGWTLAIDIPVGNFELFTLLDSLDNKILEAGGRIYLAKDSRQSSDMFWQSYQPSQWLSIRNQMDKRKIFTSDLSKRLKII